MSPGTIVLEQQVNPNFKKKIGLNKGCIGSHKEWIFIVIELTWCQYA